MWTDSARTNRAAKAELPKFHNVLREAPLSPRRHGLQEIARECARRVHLGERFKVKRVIGPYIVHPEWVATRMHTEEEVVTALLHDVIEKMLKEQKKWMAKNPELPKLFANEEQGIGQLTDDISLFFRRRGYDIAVVMPHLLSDLDVLTKRESEKANYQGYTDRAIAYARKTKRIVHIKVKMADLAHNGDEDRNLPESYLTDADKKRLNEYALAKARYKKEFPEIALKDSPLSRAARVARDEEHGGHARHHRKRFDRHRKRGKDESRFYHRLSPSVILG